jgi:hypothetical protein
MADADQKRKLQFSVKKDDYDEGGTIQFIVPYYYYNNQLALPPDLPPYNTYYGYYHSRDSTLLSAPRHEGQWANALSIAISKMASLAWEVEGNIPLRLNRAQQWLLNAGAGMGIFGWVPFLSMHLRSYLGMGRAFIEIERATPANGSKVINIHHLNPLRCRLTGNPQKPVNYLSREGPVRQLHWHQVMILLDMPDPTEGEMGTDISATERAYRHITKMASIENYVYEKVSGRRPQALYFLGGAVQRHIDDAVTTAAQSSDRQGLVSFGQAAIQAMPGDVPLTLITIPLAELPDGFDAVQERERADLVYADAIGLDPQDLNPALVGRQGLGSTGNQSVVLSEKQKGRSLATWKQDFTHNVNELALDSATLFTFQQPDLRDQKLEAENAKTRAETRKIQIEDGEITPEQATNIAVDAGDLPREFLEEDVTGGNVVTDTDKPLAQAKPRAIRDDANGRAAEATEREREAAVKEWEELY